MKQFYEVTNRVRELSLEEMSYVLLYLNNNAETLATEQNDEFGKNLIYMLKKAMNSKGLMNKWK